MKKTTLLIAIYLSAIYAYSQSKDSFSKLNLSFEKIENGVPVDWKISGSSNYTVSLDSTVSKEGKYSELIEFKEGKLGYKALEFDFPDNYEGEKITLTGYIKTENVSEGYAGLWLRIDPAIGFDNMSNRGIKGTTDWKKYEITLDLKPSQKNKIVIGGILEGKGKMWLDSLKVTIDGNEIETVKPFVLPADTDKEFDNGSGISNIKLDNKNIKNLKDLGLIWGFLKYYHPNIAKGNLNWDYELFRILPKYLKVQNNKERDAILVDWIHKLGAFEQENKTENDSLKIKMKPNLAWINKSNFSSELTSLLLKIKTAKRTESNYYIKIINGYPSFQNENAYALMKFPDEGFRVLSLFRYWNIIQYYFPYRYAIGENWKNVLQEFIPKFIKTKNETDYTITALELISRINDSHAGVWGSNQTLKKYLGINYAAPHIRFLKNKAIIWNFYDNSLGKETGLKIGDIISKVNNKNVESIVQNRLKITSASNLPVQLREIGISLLRTNDSTINIEFIRDNIKKEKTLKTYSTNDMDIWSIYKTKDTCFKSINDDIAYLNLGSLKAKYLPELWKQIKNTKGLIIDNRYYPSDSFFNELMSYLYPTKKQYVKFTGASYVNPGLFTFQVSYKTGKENKDFYKGKVVILVNEMTQSASEFIAMAIKQSTPNTVIVGSTTAGADGSMTLFYLPGNIKTAFSGVGVYYPDGRETQRVGIIPDIIVKPTIEGIKNGRDELLEKAVETINGH